MWQEISDEVGMSAWEQQVWAIAAFKWEARDIVERDAEKALILAEKRCLHCADALSENRRRDANYCSKPCQRRAEKQRWNAKNKDRKR